MALAETTRAGVEDELREAMLTGRLVDWRTGDATADDPAQGAGWDAQRTVPGALLAKLLTDTEVQPRPRALRLAGARVVGQLDLEAAELVCPLLLRACWFAEPVVLSEAKTPALRLLGCHLPGLSAARLTTRGDLRLGDGLTAEGGVRLGRAHIGGSLEFDGATLTNPDGYALDLQELRAGVLLLRDLNEPPELVDFTHACSNVTSRGRRGLNARPRQARCSVVGQLAAWEQPPQHSLGDLGGALLLAHAGVDDQHRTGQGRDHPLQRRELPLRAGHVLGGRRT
jgi:hypothetical protein